MSKKRWFAVGFLAALTAAVIVLKFLPLNTVHGRAGSVNVSGVTLGLLSPARLQGDGKAATVQLGDKTARVTANQVVLAGGRVVPISAGCKKVELWESRAGLRVLLDGAEIE